MKFDETHVDQSRQAPSVKELKHGSRQSEVNPGKDPARAPHEQAQPSNTARPLERSEVTQEQETSQTETAVELANKLGARFTAIAQLLERSSGKELLASLDQLPLTIADMPEVMALLKNLQGAVMEAREGDIDTGESVQGDMTEPINRAEIESRPPHEVTGEQAILDRLADAYRMGGV